MKRIVCSCAALLVGAFAACEPYLSLDEALEGEGCPCVAGYVCVNQVCVADGSILPNEAPPFPLRPNSPDAGEGAAGAAGAAGEGRAGAGAGDGSTSSGGAGGGSAGSSALPDAGAEPGPAPGPADSGCANPVPLFIDRDGDGFGSDVDEAQPRGCPPVDGFATRGGDCLDVSPALNSSSVLVNPGQTLAFATGYSSPNNPSGVSFDYDCDGVERPGQEFAANVTLPDCNQAVASCGGLGFGYRPTARNGAGENPLCSSVDILLCTGVAGSATCAPAENRLPRPLLCN